MRGTIKTAFKLVGVAAAYVIVGVLFYRQRGISDSEFWQSDFVVFFLPAMVVMVTNAWLIGTALPSSLTPGKRSGLSCGLAILATGLTIWAYTLIAFNAYGV